MKISVQTSLPGEAALLAVPVSQGQDSAPQTGVAAVDQAVGRALSSGDFDGKAGSTLVIYPGEGPVARVLLIGTGKREKLDAEVHRRLGGTLAKQAARLRTTRATLLLPESSVEPADATRAVAEGAVLGAYTFAELKSAPDDGPAPVELAELTVVGPDAAAEGARVGEVAARAENLARTLGNLPGNIATPSRLAEEAERIGRDHGLTVTVLGPSGMEREGMGALLAVARGTDEEPRFIVMEHRGGAEGEAPLVLVGKGLTFDAGGISIKPAQGMEEMKFDMCGGAAVIAAMQAIAELGVKANVVGVVPSTENLLGGRAMKPGDIFHTLGGKTVEVVNTDAEGRLILADALAYVKRLNPAAVLDAATLTGAQVIALGHQASAIMGNDAELVAEVKAAGDRTGERCWELPMLDEYREQIKSDYADLKNSGGRPAGTITAGWFLREFVDYPWCHLDVAGTAYGDGKLSYQIKGSTGVPTRLFIEWVLSRAG
jgi:leucyl aminopeptidase